MAKGNFRKTVTTAGAPVALSATPLLCHVVTVQGEKDNTGNICVGWDNNVRAANGSQNGIALAAGEAFTVELGKDYQPMIDLSGIYIDSTVNGDGVGVFYM